MCTPILHARRCEPWKIAIKIKTRTRTKIRIRIKTKTEAKIKTRTKTRVRTRIRTEAKIKVAEPLLDQGADTGEGVEIFRLLFPFSRLHFAMIYSIIEGKRKVRSFYVGFT